MQEKKTPDYKAMYYYLSGRMATSVETLQAVSDALVVLTESLKKAQLSTEEMFIDAEDGTE
jgi:hypothetical protein